MKTPEASIKQTLNELNIPYCKDNRSEFKQLLVEMMTDIYISCKDKETKDYIAGKLSRL